MWEGGVTLRPIKMCRNHFNCFRSTSELNAMHHRDNNHLHVSWHDQPYLCTHFLCNAHVVWIWMMDGCIKGSAVQQNIVLHQKEESEVRTATICWFAADISSGDNERSFVVVLVVHVASIVLRMAVANCLITESLFLKWSVRETGSEDC